MTDRETPDRPSLAEDLHRVALFRGLEAAAVEVLAPLFSTTHLAEGATVFREGDEGDAFYVVREGGVRVTVGGAEVARLGPGQYFGEMALITGQPRNATVSATSACELLVLGAVDFHGLMTRAPAVLTAVERITEHRTGGGRFFEDEAYAVDSVVGPGRPVVIGSGPGCDIVLLDAGLEARHAEIRQGADGRLEVVDPGTVAGVYVNRGRAGAGVPLKDGDILWAAGARLFYHDGVLKRFQPPNGIRVDASNIRVEVDGKVLLNDVSVSIRPSEFVAIVGPSGAGKTTLMRVLLGLREPNGGEVLYDGADLQSFHGESGGRIGYVPQDDILHRELPVERAMTYAAELRLPTSYSTEARHERVRSAIDALGLGERAELAIEKLSGGQRKRVSIGAELITNPGLFFLDEATSGLDPGNEAQMMRLLRRLADDGHTVVLVTHATRNVRLCDQVVFMGRGGHLAFYGPPEEALLYFGVENFDEIYERLEEEAPGTWAAAFRQSPWHEEYVRDRLAGTPAPSTAGSGHRGAVGKPPGRARQFGILVRRQLDILRRDRTGLAILLLLAPVAGLLNFLQWPRDVLSFETGDITRAMVMCFLVSFIPVLLGSVASVREVAKEKAIFARERTANVGVLAYVLSKVSVGLGISTYHGLLLSVLLLTAVDLPGADASTYVGVWVTLTLLVMSGTIWGLLVSSISPREDQALLFIIGVVMVQLVFSGGVVPISDLGVGGKTVAAATSTNWGFKGMIEATSLMDGDCSGPELSGCKLPGFGKLESERERRVALQPIDDRYAGVFGQNLYGAWGGMVVIMVACTGLFYVRQRKRARG